MSVNIYNPTTGDLTTVADSIDSLEKVSALPRVTTDLIGKIYLLTDEQTGYKKGGIYEEQVNVVTPIGTENPSEEGWYEYVSSEYVLSADTTVDSSKTYYTIEWVLISSSGDTNIFNGTLAEWEALTSDEKANYSHIATPEEADVTSGYSTTETKTGATWIDGKPIYRIVIPATINGTQGAITTISTTFFSDKHMINGMVVCNSPNENPNGFRVYHVGSSNTLSVICVINFGVNLVSNVIVEYTKTTD